MVDLLAPHPIQYVVGDPCTWLEQEAARAGYDEAAALAGGAGGSTDATIDSVAASPDCVQARPDVTTVAPERNLSLLGDACAPGVPSHASAAFALGVGCLPWIVHMVGFDCSSCSTGSLFPRPLLAWTACLYQLSLLAAGNRDPSGPHAQAQWTRIQSDQVPSLLKIESFQYCVQKCAICAGSGKNNRFIQLIQLVQYFFKYCTQYCTNSIA